MLIRDVLADARELIREEVMLLRAELREQMGAAQGIGLLFAGALLLALTGAVLLFVALGAGASDLFNVPVWASYAVLAVVLSVAAYVLVARGRTQVKQLRVLPKTRASVQENITWLQSKSIRK